MYLSRLPELTATPRQRVCPAHDAEVDPRTSSVSTRLQRASHVQHSYGCHELSHFCLSSCFVRDVTLAQVWTMRAGLICFGPSKIRTGSGSGLVFLFPSSEEGKQGQCSHLGLVASLSSKENEMIIEVSNNRLLSYPPPLRILNPIIRVVNCIFLLFLPLCSSYLPYCCEPVLGQTSACRGDVTLSETSGY